MVRVRRSSSRVLLLVAVTGALLFGTMVGRSLAFTHTSFFGMYGILHGLCCSQTPYDGYVKAITDAQYGGPVYRLSVHLSRGGSNPGDFGSDSCFYASKCGIPRSNVVGSECLWYDTSSFSDGGSYQMTSHNTYADNYCG